MRRAVIPEAERVDFCLYVDEFQNMVTSSYEETLAEARKYRLALVMAHQYLEQLSEPVRAAVFGTVRSRIAFCVGPMDAAPLVEAFGGEVPAADLVALGRGEVAAELEQGTQTRVVRGIIDPPDGRYWGRGASIRRSARFGQPREKVERQVARMLRQRGL